MPSPGTLTVPHASGGVAQDKVIPWEDHLHHAHIQVKPRTRRNP